MIYVVACLLTVLSALALVVRWDYDRRRPVWVWTLWNRALRSRKRDQRRIGRAAMLIGGALLLVPVLFGSSAEANPFTQSDAPEIDMPGEGNTAMLDPGAATPGAQGSPRTPYGEYGYAGQRWHTYDLGFMEGIFDPVSPAMNAAANFFFNVAKDFVAMTNGLHYLLLDSHAFDWLNTLVQAVSGSMFDGVFSVWAQLALLIFGAILLWHGKTGDNAGAAKRGLWAVVGFWMAASAALLPVTYNDFFRGHLVSMTAAAQAGFIDPSQSDSKNAMPDAAMKNIVYDNWLRGQFGDPENELAKKYGPRLLAAQACSKRERAEGKCDTEKKQADYEAIAQEIKDGNHGYTTFQGVNYWPRVASAGIAMYQGFYMYLFQLISKVIIVLSLVVIAILLFLLPITGLLGMINPDTLRANIKTFGTAFINAIMMGLLGGLHTRLVIWGAETLPFLMQSLFLLLVTILLLMIARPFKRMKSMLSATMEVANASFPDNFHRMYGRPHPYRPQKPSDQFFQQQRDEPRYVVRGGQGVRWRGATRGAPEERTVGGPYPRPAAPSRAALYGVEQDSPVRAHATRLAANAALAAATGGTGGAAATMATLAIGSGGGGSRESGLAGRLGGRGGGDGASLPTGGSEARPTRTGSPSPDSPPTRDSRPSTPRATPSSFGMIDTDPAPYRPTERPTERETVDVIDAQQDSEGVWHVPDHTNEKGGMT